MIASPHSEFTGSYGQKNVLISSLLILWQWGRNARFIYGWGEA